MAIFRHEISINKPAVNVFDIISDVRTHIRWQEGLIETELSNPEEKMTIGKIGIEVRKIFGKVNRFPYEITHYERLKEWSFRATSGPIQPRAILRFLETNGVSNYAEL